MRATPRALAAKPALLLFVLVAADFVWLYANPPPDRAVNPFVLYLVVFGIGVLVVSHLLIPAAIRLHRRIRPALVFAVAGFALSMIEEIVAYVTRSGIFQDGHLPLAYGLIQAGIPLFLWTLGVLLVLQRFRYSPTQIFVLAGLSGWICEALIGGFLFRSPLLALLILPAVAYSYFVLIYLPYRSIEGSLPPRHQSFWAIPAALAVPSAFWLAGGVVGYFLTRGMA